MPKIEIEVKSVKMMRETLCIAQSEVNNSQARWSDSTVRRIQELINELDKHRPLGPDGKHGELHTETCGCIDVRRTISSSGGSPGQAS